MRRIILSALLALGATAALAQNVNPSRMLFGPNGTVTLVPNIITPPAAYTAQVSALPNVLYQLDAAMPASTSAVVSGTPGIQTDTSGNVLAMSLPGGAVLSHGYGEALLVADGWSPGRPVLRDTAAQVNSGYEALNVPLSLASRVVQSGQSSDRWFAIRQLAPNSNELFRTLIGSNGIKVFGANGTDCAFRIEVNLGSALVTEPSSAATACGQRQIIEFVSNESNGTIAVLRNGVATVITPGGQVSAWVPDSSQLFNKCLCEIAFHEQVLGLPTLAQRQSELTRLVSLYPVDGTVSTLTFGPTTALPPVAIDLQSDFLTSVNIPTVQTPPTSSAVTLPAGLTFEAGATQVAGYVFGTATAGANITSTQAVYQNFFTTTMEGNRNQAIGSPMDTGQSNSNTFNAVMRTYPPASPNNLHPVLTDGLYLRAACSANHTDCRPSKIYGGMINLSQVEIRPGTTVKVRYRAPKGDHSWTPIWFFSINQHVPPAGITDLFSNAVEYHGCDNTSVFGMGNCMEWDLNDMFSRFGNGTATGHQIDFGSPDIYGSVWERGKFPHMTYGASGSGYVTHLNAGPDYGEVPTDLSAGFNDMVADWRPDGTMNIFINNVLVASAYEDNTKSVYYTKGGTNVPVSMQLMIMNQAVPGFSPGASGAVENDGLGVDGWTIAVQQIGVWQGNVANPTNFRATATNAYAGVTGDPTFGGQTWTVGHAGVFTDVNQTLTTHVARGDGSPESSSLVLVGLSTSNTTPPACKGGTNAAATCYGATAYFNNGQGDWINNRFGPNVIPALAAGTYYFWVQTPDGVDHLASPTPYVK